MEHVQKLMHEEVEKIKRLDRINNAIKSPSFSSLSKEDILFLVSEINRQERFIRETLVDHREHATDLEFENKELTVKLEKQIAKTRRARRQKKELQEKLEKTQVYLPNYLGEWNSPLVRYCEADLLATAAVLLFLRPNPDEDISAFDFSRRDFLIDDLKIKSIPKTTTTEYAASEMREDLHE